MHYEKRWKDVMYEELIASPFDFEIDGDRKVIIFERD